MKIMRPAWIDIDLDAIIHNVNAVTELVCSDAGRRVQSMPIIKGNAYGHGVYEVAKALYEEGFRNFGVAVYGEALLARQAAPDARILILGYSPGSIVEEMINNKLTPAIYTYEIAKEYSDRAMSLGTKAVVHLKVDTGMHRLGVPCTEEGADIVRKICDLPGLDVEGIFTHFATSASTNKQYVRYQYDNFMRFMKLLDARKVDIPLKHISNTGIILDDPQMHKDMARFGSMVYGCYSSIDIHTERVQLREGFSVRAEISYVKDLDPGCGIGYDLTFVTERPSRIATLPIGYADIGIRKLANNGYVLVHGKRAPIVGGVCMDQMTIDVTDIDDCKMGDVATLIGTDGEECISLREIADRIGTDTYEVIISANQRLPRVYRKDGEVRDIVDTNILLAEHYSRI